VVDDQGRRGSLVGVEQLLKHSPQLMMSLLAESPGDLVLEILCPFRVSMSLVGDIVHNLDPRWTTSPTRWRCLT
jgi:hypothetical protein